MGWSRSLRTDEVWRGEKSERRESEKRKMKQEGTWHLALGKRETRFTTEGTEGHGEGKGLGIGDWALGQEKCERGGAKGGGDAEKKREEERRRREEIWIEKKASGHEASGPRDRRRQQSGGSGLEGGNVIPAPRGWCGVVKHRQQATCRRSGLVAGLGFSLRVGRGGRAWCRGPTAFRSRWHQRRSLRSFRGGPRRGTWSSWRRGCRAG
jgi:hypothetical protein